MTADSLAKSPDERIDLIQREKWALYPAASDILQRLTALVNMPVRSRMPCVLLTGAPGMGKTSIVQRCLKDHPPEFDHITGGKRMSVAGMQMPAEPFVGDFYAELMAALGGVVAVRMPLLVLRERVETLARKLNLRLLLIDEMHSMLAGTPRQQRILLNTIRFLANKLNLSIVCAGTRDAEHALMTDQQLADRFEKFELPLWKDDAVFVQLLRSLSSVLPLREPVDLCQPEIRKRLIALSEGVTVRICRIIEDAAINAIKSGTETLNIELFGDRAVSGSLVSVANRKTRRAAGF